MASSTPTVWIQDHTCSDTDAGRHVIRPSGMRPHRHTISCRICPGRHFAERTTFLVIASILHTFKIEPHLDQDGSPILPEAKMTPGFVGYVNYSLVLAALSYARVRALDILRNLYVESARGQRLSIPLSMGSVLLYIWSSRKQNEGFCQDESCPRLLLDY